MDFEFKHPDYDNLVSGNSPYNTGSYSINRIVTQVGFNWSDVGLATPTGSVRFCLYRNNNYTGYTISSGEVGIAIKGRFTITDSSKWETLSGGVSKRTTGDYGKYKLAQWNSTQQKWVEQGYYATFKITIHEVTYDNDPTKVFSLLYLCNGPLDEDTYIPYQFYVVGSNSPYATNAQVLKNEADYSSGDARFNFIQTIGEYFYGSGEDDMEVTFDIYSTPQGVFDFWWSDLSNIPSGMYQSSYQVRLRTAALDAEPYGTCRVFNAKNYPNVSYQDFIDYFAESYHAAYDEAVRNGFTYMRIEVFHNEGSTAVVDLLGVIKIAYDGGMEDTNSTDPNFHIRLHPNSSRSANDAYDDDDTVQDEQAPGHGMSVDNLLTISYAMTDPNVLSAFGSWLWDNNLQGNIYENQVAPIENVVSCKRIPWNVMSDNDTQIKCGNVFTGVGLNPSTGLVNGDVTIAYTGHKQTVGTIKIPVFAGKGTEQTYGDFTDMESKISIYLPYCGIHMIPTSTAYRQVKDANGCAHIEGRYLTVEYIYDMIYGSCIANVYVSKTENSKKNLFLSVNGECGIDIPVTSSNRATNELALKRAGLNAVAGTIIGAGSGAALGGAIGGLIGGVGGAVKGMMQRDIEEATQETHFTTAGGFNSQVASYMSKTVTLYIEHEKYTEPSQYGHQNGYPCNLCLNLSSLHGYTELSGEAEISGIPCFIEEQEGIKEALMQGFYID